MQRVPSRDGEAITSFNPRNRIAKKQLPHNFRSI